MRDISKLNLYLAIMAFAVSSGVCIIKRITPAGALLRILISVAAFYILGQFISAMLTSDTEEENEHEESPDLLQDEDENEEFEEIEFPVVDS